VEIAAQGREEHILVHLGLDPAAYRRATATGARDPADSERLSWDYLGNQTPQIPKTEDYGKDAMCALNWLNVTEGHWLDGLNPIPKPVLAIGCRLAMRVPAKVTWSASARLICRRSWTVRWINHLHFWQVCRRTTRGHLGK